MLGLRPPLRTVSLLSHFCRPHYFPAISFLHFLKPRPPSVLPCPGPMSARPSAFDALMSSARAAAAKTKKPSPASAAMQSPNKKRKSPEPEQNPSKPPESADSNPTPASEAKKPRPVEDRVVALKSKVSLLRRKPAEFDAEAQACWGPGERVPFLFVCSAFELIAGESGRIVITDIVCNMLRTVLVTTPEDLLPVVYLLANKVAPAHEGVELGIGEASIIKALSEACGRTEKQVKSQYKEMGDLGLVAKASRGSQSMMRKPDPLTVAKVFQTFQNIAKESGKDSQERKKNHIKALLVAATDCEPLYLIRLLQAKLRIGLAEQTLLSALAQAAVYSGTQSKPPPHIKSPLEEATKILKQVYSVVPVYDRVIPALVSDGIWNLSKTCNFAPGVPVGPMLAKATKGVAEIVNKFQDMEFTCEYKYDGERAQIHFLENGSVEIYSRNAERNTGKFPDVVVAISRLKKPSITSFILDCELVAYDREKKRILPFQSCIKEPCVGEYFGEYFTLEVASGIGWFVSVDDLPTRLRGCCGEYPTSEVASWMDWSASVDDSPAHYLKILSTRARKNVVMSEIKVEVCIFAFDLLYFNGQPLIQEQLEVRRERLHSAFDEEPGFFQFATALTSNDLEEIQKFLDAAVEASSEGLIIKTLNKEATYEPSKRSNNWLKLKKDYMESIGDSLDLVPIAAIHGRGKRTGVYGAFYLACYDSNNDEYQSICKIGTGFSEAMLEERSASLRSKVIPSAKSYYRVGDGLKPDVWFEPCEVWEVKAADLTISPIYQAAVGEVDPNKGISLRFPRLLRVREDKSPEQASSSEQVAEMYNAQQHNQHNNNNLDDEDD